MICVMLQLFFVEYVHFMSPTQQRLAFRDLRMLAGSRDAGKVEGKMVGGVVFRHAS
jgi:hypothetical protein